MAKNQKTTNKGAVALIVIGALILLGGLGSASAGSIFLGLIVIACGAWPIVSRKKAENQARQAAENAARLAREKTEAETAAAARQAAEEQRQAEEEERRFQAEQAEIKETSTRRRLLAQVDELLNYANRLKSDGDNRQIILTMMEAVGQLAAHSDVEERYFREPALAHDIALFFEQMERMGLQNEIVYRRAKRVLRQKSNADEAVTINLNQIERRESGI